jgi:hypothetical protein
MPERAPQIFEIDDGCEYKVRARCIPAAAVPFAKCQQPVHIGARGRLTAMARHCGRRRSGGSRSRIGSRPPTASSRRARWAQGRRGKREKETARMRNRERGVAGSRGAGDSAFSVLPRSETSPRSSPSTRPRPSQLIDPDTKTVSPVFSNGAMRARGSAARA